MPGAAEGVLTIDFGDDATFEESLRQLESGLKKKDLDQILILKNDRGEMLGFCPHHYSYHTVPVEDFGNWRPVGCVWTPPAKAIKKPPKNRDD